RALSAQWASAARRIRCAEPSSVPRTIAPELLWRWKAELTALSAKGARRKSQKGAKLATISNAPAARICSASPWEFAKRLAARAMTATITNFESTITTISSAVRLRATLQRGETDAASANGKKRTEA